MFLRALSLAKTPVLIAIFVTPIRFFLELAGLPENVIFIIGLLWLTLAFAVYWGIKLYNEKQPYLLLVLSLIIFSPVSRFTVFVIWWIDTKWSIGTHYGLYFDNWVQATFKSCSLRSSRSNHPRVFIRFNDACYYAVQEICNEVNQ